MHKVAIFGGTFDPPHLGHIKIAKKAQSEFNFDEFIFLPCKSPVLKSAAIASSKQRIAMLELALEKSPKFSIDCREVIRDTPSYIVETLKSFRTEFGPKTHISLVLGADAYASFERWHQWKNILKLSNLLVTHRELYATPSLLKSNFITKKRDFLSSSHGNIMQIDAGRYEIASSEIRKLINSQADVSNLLPKSVSQYIAEHKIYSQVT